MKIVIDPGHGGNSRSNIGADGRYVEADGVLDISLKVRDILKGYPVEVFLTREKDMTLDAAPRVKKVNSFNADLVVSIHTNAGPESADGVETYHSVNSQIGQKGNKLAYLVQKYVCSYTGAYDRGVRTKAATNNPKQDYFFMIRDTKPTAIVVECGFHTNPSEVEKLLDDGYRYSIAKGIARGIIEYLSLSFIESTYGNIKDFKALYEAIAKEYALSKKTIMELQAECENLRDVLNRVKEVIL